MAAETPKLVKVDRKVGDNLIKISVSRTFGQGEQLNAEMDVPIQDAEDATNLMYEKVITPRAESYIKEVTKYQLEQDLMAYESEARDYILEHKAEIDERVKEKIAKKALTTKEQ